MKIVTQLFGIKYDTINKEMKVRTVDCGFTKTHTSFD